MIIITNLSTSVTITFNFKEVSITEVILSLLLIPEPRTVLGGHQLQQTSQDSAQKHRSQQPVKLCCL